MKRTVFAVIGVDDETAFKEIDDGPIPYLEREMGRLEEGGIYFRDGFIADEDEGDEWCAYINYIAAWAFNHQGDERRCSPLTFQRWAEKRTDDMCRECDCHDPDMGCTMSGLDKSYACPLHNEKHVSNGCPCCTGNEAIYPGALRHLGVPHIRYCPNCGRKFEGKQ